MMTVFLCGGTSYDPMEAWRVFREFREAEGCYMAGTSTASQSAAMREGLGGHAIQLVDELVAERLGQSPPVSPLLTEDDIEPILRALNKRLGAGQVPRHIRRFLVVNNVRVLLPFLGMIEDDQRRTFDAWWQACAAEIEASGGRLEDLLEVADWRRRVFRRLLTPELWDAIMRAKEENLLSMPPPPAIVPPGGELLAAARWRSMLADRADDRLAAARRRRAEIWP